LIVFAGFHRNYPETNLGDGLLMIPLIMHFAESQEVYLEMNNKAVQALLKHPRIHDIRELPSESTQSVVRIAMNDLIAQLDRNFHPTVGLFKLFSVPTTASVLTPQISYNQEVTETYDYVIAPFSEDKNREWELSRWNNIIPNLGKVAVIGHSNDMTPWPNVDYHLGKSLDYVCSLMKNAKRVVTIDSGPSRLGHALELNDKQYILCSNIVPQAWGSYPQAKTLYGNPRDWTPNIVNDFIR